MKLALFLAAASMLFAADPAAVTYVDSAKVASALEKGGALAKGSDFTVSGARRTGPGQVEVHDKETDIFYIVDGEATFVTGGKMINGKQTRPGSMARRKYRRRRSSPSRQRRCRSPFPQARRTGSRKSRSPINYYMVKVLKP